MGKRIAVVGVGALGGYVGGWLAHTGEDVTLIDFWPENIETIRRNGLELDGVTPEEKITVNNAKAMQLTETDRLCIPVPLYHCFGMVLAVLACVSHGSAMVFPGEAFDPLETLQKWRPRVARHYTAFPPCLSPSSTTPASASLICHRCERALWRAHRARSKS